MRAFMRSSLWSMAATCSLALLGCGEVDPTTSSTSSTRSASPTEELEPATLEPATMVVVPIAESGSPTPESAEWEAHVLAIQPVRARSGVLRLADPALEHPAAAPLLLARLTTGNEPSEVRAALAAALARTEGDFLDAVVELLGTEADPMVRAALVSTLRRAEGPAVIAGLELALVDEDVGVRLAAAIEAGRVSQGEQLAEPLTALLDDADTDVRLSAARSLGYLEAGEGKPGLAILLGDDDARLRLAALQALDRIDPTDTTMLDRIDELLADPDPKVSAAARKIADR
jgi:HEAT repeat protein